MKKFVSPTAIIVPTVIEDTSSVFSSLIPPCLLKDALLDQRGLVENVASVTQFMAQQVELYGATCVSVEFTLDAKGSFFTPLGLHQAILTGAAEWSIQCIDERFDFDSTLQPDGSVTVRHAR